MNGNNRINAYQGPRSRILAAAGLALVLAGCVSSDIGDLEQWVQEVLARPGGRIKPLPEIKPYEAYAYKSAESGARDPFVPFYSSRSEEKAKVADTGLSKELEQEIKNRNREELEQFELDSLRMVGTIKGETENWGIIKDPAGVVHRVKAGNYMGRNIGKIVNIFEDKIELREIVQNNQGRWEERQAAVALVE
jgi:type IV pilus assembly protein PilP